MASAAPAPAKSAQLRPSFATVAASALKPPVSTDAPSKPRPPVATPKTLNFMPSTRPLIANGATPRVLVEHHKNDAPDAYAQKPAPRTEGWSSVGGRPIISASQIKEDDLSRPRSIAVAKLTAAEDNSTQVSSSDGSGKPPSIDGKSVASATTFALDEKESLRPDDSASLRAVEEEDVASPPDSVIADSRQGSENGAARAFHDQLHEIAVMNPQPQRGGPPGRFPAVPNGAHTIYEPNQLTGVSAPIAQPFGVNPSPNPGGPNLPVVPDEKLLEALQSPRDRLFIVKLEQDFIDFIKEPRETEYSLPNCNTFYRMLAHRLADYYLLGHVVDLTMTGVKITRTPYCRIPPPISQMVDPTKAASTPPAELPMRKIMRRDDGKSGTNTAANSRNPSKTTSEAGGSDGSNEGPDAVNKEKDKAALTREEREARYKEARQRIFGKVEQEDGESADPSALGEDKDKAKDASRSSSASGKKKTKKQRTYDDDDFQTRSRYNPYYPPQYAIPAYSAENVMHYNGGSKAMVQQQLQPANPGSSPPLAYSNPYPAMVPSETQPQYGWGQQYQPNTAQAAYQNYGPAHGGYDLSADFQRGMSSFQTAGINPQATPKMTNTPMASYQESYHHQGMPQHPSWSQATQQPSYPMPQSPYTPPTSGHRPGSASHQGHNTITYPYGQFPPNPNNGKLHHNQHPIPGSYNRQFNPQSQAFIPGGRNTPYQMPPTMARGSSTGHNYQTVQQYGSTNVPYQLPSPVSGTAPPFSYAQGLPMNSTSVPVPRAPPQLIEQGQQPSSIAKYGTPSNLPAKPPAPATSQPTGPKFGLPAPAGAPLSNPIGAFSGGPTAAPGSGGAAHITNTTISN